MSHIVHAQYLCWSHERDVTAYLAAGRPCDRSGSECTGERDLEWTCKFELDANRMARNLTSAGFKVSVRKHA